MENTCCSNQSCVDREIQLRLARLREELLTNFNHILIDRIRFLEQTINRLSLASTPSATRAHSIVIDKQTSPDPIITDHLHAPRLSLRRSSSATTYFLQRPDDPNRSETGAAARSCPSSVDLSNHTEQRKWFLSIKRPLRTGDRASSESHSQYLSIPRHRQWASSTSDLISSTFAGGEKGRLESRRFACDVDDNDVRAFKAMIYMEQARKQHARPLSRLRQALGISSHPSIGYFTPYNSKKPTNS